MADKIRGWGEREATPRTNSPPYSETPVPPPQLGEHVISKSMNETALPQLLTSPSIPRRNSPPIRCGELEVFYLFKPHLMFTPIQAPDARGADRGAKKIFCHGIRDATSPYSLPLSEVRE